MKTFEAFMSENIVQIPGDRSLEGFRYLLDLLQQEVKGVLNPTAKAAIQPLVLDFYQKMRTTLIEFQKQGVGYSPNYQPRKVV